MRSAPLSMTQLQKGENLETVKIVDVKKNARDWYEITLDGDDRVVATKNDKLAEAATAAVGKSAEVEINTQTRGAFTNHYLNEIDGVKDDSKPRASAKPRSPISTGYVASGISSGGRDSATQERIARQWAYGRAIELLMASDKSFDFPLDSLQFDSLRQQAEALLDATK